MTIEAQGHVHSMEYHGADRILVTLVIEANRIAQPYQVTIIATEAELAHYRVGIPIKIQIRPNGSPASGETKL